MREAPGAGAGRRGARDPLMERFDAALERDDPSELQLLILDVALESNAREWAEWACGP
jgi:hypothetical protein